MDELSIIQRAPVLASLPTCPLGCGGSTLCVHLVFSPESSFMCDCWNSYEQLQMVSLLCVFLLLPDGEEAPSVYIWPFCPGSVTPHQGQLPGNDWRNYLCARTKDPGRFGQTNLLSRMKVHRGKKGESKSDSSLLPPFTVTKVLFPCIFKNNGTQLESRNPFSSLLHHWAIIEVVCSELWKLLPEVLHGIATWQPCPTWAQELFLSWANQLHDTHSVSL